MLNFTIKAGEYFNIGDDIRVVILGGCANKCRVMVDAPREYNIVRGKVLERNAATEEEKNKLGHYYPEPKLPPETVRRMIAKQQKESGRPGAAESAGRGKAGRRSDEGGQQTRREAGQYAETKAESRKTASNAQAEGQP